MRNFLLLFAVLVCAAMMNAQSISAVDLQNQVLRLEQGSKLERMEMSKYFADRVSINKFKEIKASEDDSDDYDDVTWIDPTWCEAVYWQTDWQFYFDDDYYGDGSYVTFNLVLDILNNRPDKLAGNYSSQDLDSEYSYYADYYYSNGVEINNLDLSLLWVQDYDYSSYYPGFTRCGVYFISASFEGSNGVKYMMMSMLPVVTYLGGTGGSYVFINVTDGDDAEGNGNGGEGTGTTLENVDNQDLYRIVGKDVIITKNAPVTIYDTTGKLIYTATARENRTISGLPQNQTLILHCGDKSAKIVL